MHKFLRLLIHAIFAVALAVSSPVFASSASSHLQLGVHLTDAQIESTIQTKLSKSKIGKDGFRFKVAHGVVTWEGSTPIGQHKGAATRMARTSGAVQVINNIHVTGGLKPGTPMKKAFVQ